MNTDKNYLNYIKASLLSGVILVLLISVSYAETYYVSPTGSAGWKESVNIETPCSAATAMKNAVAGDTVYFRGGQYDLYHDPNIHESYYWYRGILGPSNSGTSDSPITFAAYPGEIPIMNSNGWRALGNGDKNYIIFDGFTLKANNGKGMGALIITDHNIGGRVKGNIVRNCIFDGGTTIDTFTDNREGLRIEGTSHTLIRNCKFYNYRETNNNHNTSAIKTYDNDHLTIENTEIYNCSLGIFLKKDTDDSIIRYNYIHDCHKSLFAFVKTSINSISDRNQVYHNVIAKCFEGFSVGYRDGTGDEWEVFNNTFYSGIGCSNGRDWKIWNNIIASGAIGAYGGNTLSECDHNLFAPDNDYIARLHIYEKNDKTYKSLYSWQSSRELEGGGNPGAGSLVADPKFINYSGKMNQLNDFLLAGNSPCRGAGRRGENMGADITKVGYKGSAGESSADNTLSADFNTGFELEEDETGEIQSFEIPHQSPEAVWLPQGIDLTKHTKGPFTVKIRVEGIDTQKHPIIFPRIRYYIGTGSSHGYFEMIHEGDNVWRFDIPDPNWYNYRSNSLHYHVKVFDEKGGVITESHWQIELIDSFVHN